MATRILETLLPIGEDVFYSLRFKRMFDDHVETILKDSELHNWRNITDDDLSTLFRYSRDWYGFLSGMSIQKKYHWPILRLNGSRDPLSLSTDISGFFVPDFPYVDKLGNLCKQK